MGGHVTTNVYDASRNLTSVTDPLGHTTSYAYDSNGNRVSVTYPATATSKNTTSYSYYNQYSEPTSTTDELGNARIFNYDANYLPQSVTDSASVPASFLFKANSTLEAGGIGYEIGVKALTQTPASLGRTTGPQYNANGCNFSVMVP